MMKNRPTYGVEFRLEAAQLVTEQGCSIPEAAKSMGVSESAIRKWVNQHKREQQGQNTQMSHTKEQKEPYISCARTQK